MPFPTPIRKDDTDPITDNSPYLRDIRLNGGVPHEPTLGGLEYNLIGVRNLIADKRKEITRETERLVNAVADFDVSPEHDRQRHHNIAQSIRRFIASKETELAELLGLESYYEEGIRERVGELLAAE